MGNPLAPYDSAQCFEMLQTKPALQVTFWFDSYCAMAQVPVHLVCKEDEMYGIPAVFVQGQIEELQSNLEASMAMAEEASMALDAERQEVARCGAVAGLWVAGWLLRIA